MEEGTRQETIPFDVFVKRSWPLFAVGAVFILFASGILLWFALSGKGRKVPEVPSTLAQVTETTSSQALVPRALDGVLVSPTDAHLLPYAVMIDNHADARPSAGLADASLVYELPVEGGFTRYMAIFDATSSVDQIGPVRSARPYCIDFADGLDAVYAHVGGSPEALNQIQRTAGFRNVDEFSSGSAFWRSKKRPAPHNAYTRMDLLRTVADAKHWTAGQWRSWRYTDEHATGTEPGPMIGYGGIADVSWAYDKQTNAYLRSLAGKPHLELDGKRVQARNIVVILTDAEIMDAEGRLKLRTSGRGKAILYRDGKKQQLTWRRASGEHIQFEAVDGLEVFFSRGTTWVEVVTSKAVFDAVSK